MVEEDAHADNCGSQSEFVEKAIRFYDGYLHTDRASAFRVFGFYNGLLASACEHDPYGDAYAGAVVTLTESGAPQYALYVGETYTAGKTLIDGLVASV